MNHLTDGLLALAVIATAVVLLVTASPPTPDPTQDAAEIRSHLLHAHGSYGSLRADIAVATLTQLVVHDERITTAEVDADVLLPPDADLRCELTGAPDTHTAERRWGHRSAPATSVAAMTIPLPEVAPQVGADEGVREGLDRVYAALPRPLPPVHCVVSTADDR
jgi:hypothetical protein